MTAMCSVPLSGSHTSPGRPRIWRMLAPSRGKAEALERLAGRVEAHTALPPQSLTQTLSRSST